MWRWCNGWYCKYNSSNGCMEFLPSIYNAEDVDPEWVFPYEHSYLQDALTYAITLNAIKDLDLKTGLPFEPAKLIL